MQTHTSTVDAAWPDLCDKRADRCAQCVLLPHGQSSRIFSGHNKSVNQTYVRLSVVNSSPRIDSDCYRKQICAKAEEM